MLALFIRIIVLFALIVNVTGCMGLSHARIKVPPLQISGKLAGLRGNQNETGKLVYIVVPEFYGESRALIDLVKGNLKANSLYHWNKLDLPAEGELIAAFKEEERYIGSVFPFSPSRKTMESRTMFIWADASNYVYRVRIYGTQSTAEKTSMKSLQDSLPLSLKGDSEKPWGGPREAELALEIEYYRKTKWDKAEAFRAIQVSRTPQLDKLIFEIRNNGGS